MPRAARAKGDERSGQLQPSLDESFRVPHNWQLILRHAEAADDHLQHSIRATEVQGCKETVQRECDTVSLSPSSNGVIQAE